MADRQTTLAQLSSPRYPGLFRVWPSWPARSLCTCLLAGCFFVSSTAPSGVDITWVHELTAWKAVSGCLRLVLIQRHKVVERLDNKALLLGNCTWLDLATARPWAGRSRPQPARQSPRAGKLRPQWPARPLAGARGLPVYAHLMHNFPHLDV